MTLKNLDSYYAFISDLDKKIEELTFEHSEHLNCKKGCDLCCYSFRIFPVEYFAIANQLNLNTDPDKDNAIEEKERCAFLKNGACTIYDQRPMICRTHGLPLLSMNEEGTDWELSFCELNFTTADDEEFHDDNVLIQDSYNSMLFQLNKAFLEQNSHLDFTEFDLIPLKELLGK
jgi:Fe-S-cluster containining protein